MTEYLDRYPTMHEYAEGKRINPELTDLISRADAIDAIMSEPMNEPKYPIWFADKIKALPSAELPNGDLISRADAICEVLVNDGIENIVDRINKLPAAEAVPQSEQYKKGFEDAKRAFLIEYARESENMRKRNAQIEVMLNVQKAISAETAHGEWVDWLGNGNEWECSICKCSVESHGSIAYKYCPMCGARMKGGAE